MRMEEAQALEHLRLYQKKNVPSLDQRQILGGLMLDYGLWIGVGNQQDDGRGFSILSRLVLDTLFIRLLGLRLVKLLSLEQG